MIRQIREIAGAPEGTEHKGYFLVSDLALRKTRGGRDYATLLLRDASGVLPAKLWRESLPLLEKHGITNGSKVLARIKVRRFRGRPEAEVLHIWPIESRDYEEGFRDGFLERWAERDVEEMYAELHSLVDSIERAPVRALVQRVLERYGSKLKVMPGARSIHHAYRGGLLEHVLTVSRICRFLGGMYEGMQPGAVDRDLLLAGAILHDMGKIEEIDPDQVTTYTAYGTLVGHILLGRDIVRDCAAGMEDLDPRDLLLIEHLIVSHQGRKEWGAPQEPRTVEAVILHYADDCDAKVNIFFSALERDKSDGELTAFHSVLGRRLWKGGGKPAEKAEPAGRQGSLDLKPPEPPSPKASP